MKEDLVQADTPLPASSEKVTEPAEQAGFTPGTWHASKTFRATGYAPGVDVGSSNGSNIALVHHDRLDRDAAETRANALLMAASKDLYEALKAAEQFISNGIELHFIRMPEPPASAIETLPKIRAALAKVRGEAS